MERESKVSPFRSQDCTPSRKDHVLKVTVATTAQGWGITSNDQLVTELAKNPRVKVYGLVPHSTQEQRDQAKKSNIELVNAKKRIGFSEKELISHPPDSLDIDVLIIHSYGRDLGKQAQDIKEKKNCKWVHVVHTISEELNAYAEKVLNPGPSHPKESESEHELQLALCEEADMVIAIGPKVADAYKNALLYCGKHKSVITLTPGIVHDLIGIPAACDGGKKFRIMISATYPSKYFKVKGCDTAAQAITSLRDTSYHLTYVILPTDSAEELKQQLKGLTSISAGQFIVRPVSRSIEDWRKLLCQIDLTIMPSAEGFGTSCVRSISANVPVLCSRNSGFGMALEKLPSGGMHVLDSEDPQVWAKKIKEIRDKGLTQRHLDAKQLRKEYMENYCLRDQCDKIVDKMMEMFPSNQESKKKNCVEHTEDTSFVTETVQELCLADEKYTNKLEQENVDKPSMPKEVKDICIPRTSVEETVIDKKFAFAVQENVAHDTVDAGVAQTMHSGLTVNARDIPYAILGKVCLRLNIKDDVCYKDFRMLGELMNIEKGVIEILAQGKNPTYELINLWCSKTRQATVGRLIEILKHEDLDRMDVVEILEEWARKKESQI